MTDEIVALLLLWFIVANGVTYQLFARSHHRVAFRQTALPSSVLIAGTLLGGAPAAYAAGGRFRMIGPVMDRRLVALLCIVQIGLLAWIVANAFVTHQL